uniref:Uncharacterized protein n=1 Tax=Anguilla anguilla TaxID=7936 RepID=A0A0E9S6Z2_ANGAN
MRFLILYLSQLIKAQKGTVSKTSFKWLVFHHFTGDTKSRV